MSKETTEEMVSDAINMITERASRVVIDEFVKLPSDLQMNVVLVKSAQLLLANVLCQVASNMEELDALLETQSDDMKELTMSCAVSAFTDKFSINTH